MNTIDFAVQLIGTTVPFEGYGRTLGYPTANIDVQTDLDDGVYFGRADLGIYKNHPAIIFVGTPTTVGATKRRVEAHLLDIADNDYYDKTLTLSVCHFYRPNETFDSVDELKTVMESDEAAARKWMEIKI